VAIIPPHLPKPPCVTQNYTITIIGSIIDIRF
jgi:hypothetical protein